MKNIKVRAYCSSANLGPGFDIVAVALDAFYDEVEVSVKNGRGDIRVTLVEGPYSSRVDPEKNTAIEALKYIISKYDLKVDVELKIWKGIPVGLGLGSSGATAAASVKALSELLGAPSSIEELIEAAGEGERVSAGEPHYDNVSASVLGGLVLLYSTKPLRVASFKIGGCFVLGIPLVETPENKTKLMRSVLPREVELKKMVYNTSRLTALLVGLLTGDLETAGRGMEDIIVEAARAPLIPCYAKVKEEAFNAGALGVALSGAGPSIIALSKSKEEALIIASAMKKAYESCGLEAITKIAYPAPGAHVVEA